MKQDKFIKACGPYKVHSISQDMRGVRLEVFPAFPQYNLTAKEKERMGKRIDSWWAKDSRWAIHRLNGRGGGPGIFTAIALANAFEKFLNQHYADDDVKSWKDTLAEATKKIREKNERQLDRWLKKHDKDSSSSL